MINVVHLGFFLSAHALVHVKCSLVSQSRLHLATVCSASRQLSREAAGIAHGGWIKRLCVP